MASEGDRGVGLAAYVPHSCVLHAESRDLHVPMKLTHLALQNMTLVDLAHRTIYLPNRAVPQRSMMARKYKAIAQRRGVDACCLFPPDHERR